MKKHHEEGAAGMPEQEKEKDKAPVATTAGEQANIPAQPVPAAKVPGTEEEA
jgi:hypothetical protein